MSKCVSQHGEYSEHQVTDGVCDYCGVVDESPLITGLREIQELHCDDGSGNCEACFFPGKEGDWQSVKHPCTTRQLADKALGGAS